MQELHNQQYQGLGKNLHMLRRASNHPNVLPALDLKKAVKTLSYTE